MNEELYDLYKRDEHFKQYVDKFCHKHDLGLFEALSMNILREYGKYVKESKK